MQNDDIVGRWNYGATPQFPYGEETSYRKAMAFLDGPYVIEDWGCGTAWARKFVERGRYIGLDGSWSMHCDKVVDLRTYRSEADAILVRHILEHNHGWKKILENALASFQKKFALVMFTPFSSGETHSIGSNPEGTIPDLSFKKQDLLDLIGKFPYTEESVPSATQYGFEHVFYIARSASDLPKRAGATASGVQVSIVIPTFNHLEDLLKPNLESLRQFTDLSNVEVVVVANGCTDGTEDYVRSLWAPFKVLSFPDPLGYTKATNEGLKAASGAFVVLLNNDIVFLPQAKNLWLDMLLAPFKGNPKMGVTGPLQLHDHYAGQDVIVASCLCISRAALEAAGGLLDEVYSPGGGEDVDLCCKVRAAGYTVRQVPRAGEPGRQWANVDGTFPIWHKNNQTFKDVPDYWSKIVRRNGLINLKRHNKNIKLNLFGKARDGYASLDDPSDLLAYVIADPVRPDFEVGSVSEILAVQPFDWCVAHQSWNALGGEDPIAIWFRLLKPGGKLVLELGHRDGVNTDALSRVGFVDIKIGPGNGHVEAVK